MKKSSDWSINEDGNFTGVVLKPIKVGDIIETRYGAVTVAEILYHNEYEALGEGSTYAEQSENSRTAYFYKVSVTGKLEMSKHVADLIWDRYPDLGQDPPNEYGTI